MPRGVKRQITTKDNQKEEDVVHETSSSTKRIRSVSNKEENMILFENMKKEAEENRKRVLKEYLQDQNMPLAVNQPTVKPSRRETIAATSTSSSRTPTGRRKSVDGKSTGKLKVVYYFLRFLYYLFVTILLTSIAFFPLSQISQEN